MTDYIRLPRSALSDELWRNKDFGCLLWYLLARADEKGISMFTAGEIKTRLGISRQRLRTMLGKMQKSGLVTSIQPTTNQQATSVTFDFQHITPIEQPASNQLPTNKQPTKASRKLTKFIPPTDEEVVAYVTEKGYHFNPAQFVPHYQSKGWKVGKEPMKDWRAACRTWENSWKEKHGERFYYEIQPIAIQRVALAAQADRYSELERAADTVLFNAPYGNPTKND